MTLTEFLLARIAEDEADARSMPFAPDWTAHPDEPGQPIKAAGCARLATCAESVMAHIARHDPARVLAECDAKRRIVEKAQRADAAFNQMINPASSAASFALTEVLGYLALPYADHPDYRDEWRP